MPQSTLGLHHKHKRKRIHQKREQYPHPDKLIRFFDGVIIAMGFIVPLFTIPQAMEIWVNKSAAGLSAITWMAYLANTIVWTIYGILHRTKPIVLTFSLMTSINIVIVTGIVVF
ncbi:hypothetical protein COV82_06305 [Candidatus Peregrinibacteria bacterium CG11_big_fil_rev_8_21_14_0_20_46_8]|nr:MAG: hypothetical protein COV82_06305 [Candidatus Peregrinibacteria bacterium CG11_big_fil_rev_8_21_14_0_20_46_8]